MVKWIAKLSNNEEESGAVTDGSWKLIKQTIHQSNDLQITELSIANDIGSGTIDKNCDGYFIGNKSIALLGSSGKIELVGIGYWKKNEDVVRVKWYHKDSMRLFMTEAKPLKDCDLFLIKNTK